MTEAALRERPVTSRQIRVGDVPIGGGAQGRVQSMTNTMTYDVEATVQQVYDLNAAGADLVRVSVNGSRALKGFREVSGVRRCRLSPTYTSTTGWHWGPPTVALRVRINPGNVGSDDRYRRVIEKCQRRARPCASGSTQGP